MANQLSDKVSYIRGLMEGMQFDTDSNESRLLGKIVEVLGDMAAEIEAVSDAQDELSEYVDSIDEDLADLEDALLGDEEDDEDYDEDDYDDDDEDIDDDEVDDDDIDDEDIDSDVYVECVCPECKGSFYVKENELSEEALHVCPRCGARIHAVPGYENDEEIPVAHLAEDEEK
ncbi:MAG: hypothetical protein IKS52_10095 [Clostridia bacterium]|nr:hypothetical protein [Clostridia bacterium]MBR4443604.1 hypothetical protein [Clostridia bacterium]